MDVPAVMDIGSATLKLGLAGFDEPQVKCENMIGRPKHFDLVTLTGKKDKYIGSIAQSKRSVLSISYPVVKGLIKNLNDLEEIIHYSFFTELKEAPEEHPLLLTEQPIVNKDYRLQMSELLFETFNIPSLYIKPTSTLSLFASGRTTGIVLDSGEGMNWAVPMSEGWTFPHAIMSNECAGGEVTNYLMQKLRSSNRQRFESSSDREVVSSIKHSLCYAFPETTTEKAERKKIKRDSLRKLKEYNRKTEEIDKKIAILEQKRKKLDEEEQGPIKRAINAKITEKDIAYSDFKGAEAELKRLETLKKKKSRDLLKQYVLPDGNKVSLAKERYDSVEVLFDPPKIGMEVPGVHELLFESTQLCNLIVRPDLYRNIVLVGGCTLISGFEDRFKREIEALAPKSESKVKINVIAPKTRQYSSWIGGSVFCLMPTFSENSLTKEEYEEEGKDSILKNEKIHNWEKNLYN